VNQPSPFLSKTERDSASKAAGADRGTPDLADYHDFTSRMTEFAQGPTYVDDDASEISEGSSTDYDAPPGHNKAIPRTRSSRHGMVPNRR
jgi:hypothetical protein